MKPGDLIREYGYEYDPPGLLLKVEDRRKSEPYIILCANGKILKFSKKYIETDCYVASEARV